MVIITMAIPIKILLRTRKLDSEVGGFESRDISVHLSLYDHLTLEFVDPYSSVSCIMFNFYQVYKWQMLVSSA